LSVEHLNIYNKQTRRTHTNYLDNMIQFVVRVYELQRANEITFQIIILHFHVVNLSLAGFSFICKLHHAEPMSKNVLY